MAVIFAYLANAAAAIDAWFICVQHRTVSGKTTNYRVSVGLSARLALYPIEVRECKTDEVHYRPSGAVGIPARRDVGGSHAPGAACSSGWFADSYCAITRAKIIAP